MKVISAIYCILSILVLLFTIDNVIGCHVSLKYDLEPDYLEQFPIDKLFIASIQNQLYIHYIYIGYIILSLAFLCYIWLGYRKKNHF